MLSWTMLPGFDLPFIYWDMIYYKLIVYYVAFSDEIFFLIIILIIFLTG